MTQTPPPSDTVPPARAPLHRRGLDMDLVAHVAFWLAVAMIAAGVVWLLSDILGPFLLGAIVAYFLVPVVDRLAQRGLSRPMAALVLLVTLVGTVGTAVAVFVPIIVVEVIELIERLPRVFAEVRSAIDGNSARLFASDTANAKEMLSEAADAISNNSDKLVSGLSFGVRGVVQTAMFVVVMPVVAFYLMCDWHRLVASVAGAVPRHSVARVNRVARDIDDTLAGFVRGQSIACVLLAVYYGAGLLLAGLNYGLVIGVVTGLISFVPVIGALIGGALAIGVAASQFWSDPQMIAVVVAIYAIGQVLEGQILVPRLVGDSIRLHPVWLIFAVLAFGAVFGFVGALLAVPLAAVLGVLVRHGYARYRTSGLYDQAAVTPDRDAA